jgi:hypothetical protein
MEGKHEHKHLHAHDHSHGHSHDAMKRHHTITPTELFIL